MRHTALASLLILLAMSVDAQIGTPGGTLMPSLKIPQSPRSQGFGGAGSAFMNDGAYATLNPASILNLEQDRIFLGHTAFLQESRTEFLNATLFYGKIPLGVSLLYHDMGTAPITLDGSDFDENNTFHAYDAAFQLTSGYLYRGVKLGATLKGVRESIWDAAVNGMALDLGAISPTPVKGLTAGVALSNLGFTSSFVDESFPLTSIFRLGAGYVRDIPGNLIGRGAVDIVITNDSTTVVPLGIELSRGVLSARAGYALFHTSQSFSAGFSIEYLRFVFDYAYVNYTDDLMSSGRPHFLALSLIL